MNDLLISPSFKKYQDNGIGTTHPECVNLVKFREDVENVEKDMADVKKLYKRLQKANKEWKTVHNAITMKELRSRMDGDLLLVLKRCKLIKAKLIEVEKSNAANRSVPGCGPGFLDRMRSSIVSDLKNKLKGMMHDFQGLRSRMNYEYKETVARLYFTITGKKADENLIENLISSGGSETFMLKAIQKQEGGQIMDTISEIQERHDAVKEIEKNLVELHQIYIDMVVLVEAQGQYLTDIESHMKNATSFVRRGTEQVHDACEYPKNSRKWTYVVLLIIILVIAITFPIWSHILREKRFFCLITYLLSIFHPKKFNCPILVS